MYDNRGEKSPLFIGRKCSSLVRTLLCESVALYSTKVDSVVVWGRLLQGVDKWRIV